MGKVEQFLSEPRDGIDQWSMLMGNDENQRNELIYNINLNHKGYKGAIRIGDYKLSVGYPGDDDGHYPPANFTDIDNNSGGLINGYETEKAVPYIMDEEEIYL